MDEQWNKALDQVEDRFLLEATGERRKLPIRRIAGMAAAMLVFVAGWTFLFHEWNNGGSEPPVILPTQEPAQEPTEAPTQSSDPLKTAGSEQLSGGGYNATGAAGSAYGDSQELIPPAMGIDSVLTGMASEPPAEWMDLSQATVITNFPGAEGTVTEIGEGYFYLTADGEPPVEFWISGEIGQEWTVGDRVFVTLGVVYHHPETGRYAGELWGIFPPRE